MYFERGKGKANYTYCNTIPTSKFWKKKKQKQNRRRQICADNICEPHACCSEDEEQYESLQDKQIKAIYLMVREGWICHAAFTYIYLCSTSIFMNIPDNGITPALLWIIPEVDLPLEWYLGWNRTHPASNYNRLGVCARFGFIKQWTERKENAKLDFFSNIYMKSSQDRISFQGLTVTVSEKRGRLREYEIWKERWSCFSCVCRFVSISFYFVYIYTVHIGPQNVWITHMENIS